MTKNLKFVFIVSFLVVLSSIKCLYLYVAEQHTNTCNFFMISNFLTQMCSFGHVTHTVGRCRVGFRGMRCLVCNKSNVKYSNINVIHCMTKRHCGSCKTELLGKEKFLTIAA